ncbi:hypothetical protein [Gramella sp. AN32]|uniref:Lipoprotein n=1 Tax=Christiangramia antarctica TaxID=2058158 RepID=A0ABW5X5R4_9FLAO|nr:hypothetical protein [Gramella sp. AN32]MCM4156299.1 hypothetical protein [Gramella sp. AN32]
MKKFLFLLTLVFFITACETEEEPVIEREEVAEETEEPAEEENQQAETLDLGTVKTQEIIRFSSDKLIAQQYQVTLDGQAITIEKFNAIEYILVIPGVTSLGKQEIKISEIDNFVLSVNILETTITNSAEDALKPFFDNILAFEESVNPASEKGTNVLSILEAFKKNYATLSNDDKLQLAKLYTANKSFIDDTILDDYERINHDQLAIVGKYILSVTTFSAATVAATIDPELISKSGLVTIAAIALYKSYDYKDQLSASTLKKVDIAINSIESSLSTQNEDNILELYNNENEVFPFETRERSIISSDKNDSNKNLKDFFGSFLTFNTVLEKLNSAIQFVNDEIWFSNVSLFERDFFPDSAQVENIPADQTIFYASKFTISDSRVNLNNVSFSDGHILINASYADQNSTDNYLDTFLEFTYTDEFNELEGKYPIRLHKNYNYKIQFIENPNYGAIVPVETLSNGDSYTIPNFVWHHYRLLLDNEPVLVDNGSEWSRVLLGDVPKTGDTITMNKFPIYLRDATNNRVITINLDLTLVNEAYKKIVNNSFTMQLGLYGVPFGAVSIIKFNDNGTYSTYLDGSLIREGNYSFTPQINNYYWQDCQDYEFKGRGIAAIHLTMQSSPSYMMFFDDGQILANSTYGCYNNYMTYHYNKN